MNYLNKSLILLLTLILQGCGSSNDSEGKTEVGAEVEVLCASFGDVTGQYDGEDCIYPSDFSSLTAPITADITLASLPNEGAHVFQSELIIGKDCSNDTECSSVDVQPTLTIEAGTKVAFIGGVLLVNRGAKIMAKGSLSTPIWFLPARNIPRVAGKLAINSNAKWLGVVINGKAPVDGCVASANDCHQLANGFVSHYGGNESEDSSGELSFVKIVDVDSEGGSGSDFPSLQLSGVGRGTKIDYIHIHRGWDDGVAVYGGNVDLRHVVVTHAQDDAFDFDHNWFGKAEFLFALHGSYSVELSSGLFEVKAGNFGIEHDGRMRPYTEQPQSTPFISNVTIITSEHRNTADDEVSSAIGFDDYAVGDYHNILMVNKDTNTSNPCIKFKSDGDVYADAITFTGAVINCLEPFYESGFSTLAPEQLKLLDKAEWFQGIGENAIYMGTVEQLDADGFSTNIEATSLPSPSNLGSADYVGAVSNSDKQSDWYHWIQLALESSEED